MKVDTDNEIIHDSNGLKTDEDHEMAKNRIGQVYIVRLHDNRIKIGFTGKGKVVERFKREIAVCPDLEVLESWPSRER